MNLRNTWHGLSVSVWQMMRPVSMAHNLMSVQAQYIYNRLTHLGNTWHGLGAGVWQMMWAELVASRKISFQLQFTYHHMMNPWSTSHWHETGVWQISCLEPVPVDVFLTASALATQPVIALHHTPPKLLRQDDT